MPYSLYFHIPFCTHRCAYCDFNTYAGQESLIPDYVDALCNEIRFVASKLPSPLGGGVGGECGLPSPFGERARGEGGLPSPFGERTRGEGGLPSPLGERAKGEGGLPSPLGGGAGGEGESVSDAGVHTIFFGGGTPSLLTPLQFEKILQTIRASFILTPSDTSNTSGTVDPSETSGSSATSGTFFSLETSLEANPGTVNLASLRGLRQIGFNRISFGVQSFHPDELRLLERIHDPFDVLQAVRWARQAGFGNLNLDLIYGLPEQTPSRWKDSLRWAVGLAPEHLSLYGLTIEPGTLFGRWAKAGLLPLPDPDLAADMYEAAADYLSGQGYEQYEISNWSRPGFQCQHNLQVWRNQPYLGFGAGAHGCANGLRVANVLRIKSYLDHLSLDRLNPDEIFPISPATASRIRLTLRDEMQETLLLGLRLTQEGVSTLTFRSRFGKEMREVFGKEIDELVGLGLLEWADSPLPLGEGSGVRADSLRPSGKGPGVSADSPPPLGEGLGVRVDSLRPSEVEPGVRADSPPPLGEGMGVREAGRWEVLRLTRRGRLLGNQVFLRFVGD